MSQVSVIATIVAKPKHEYTVQQALQALIEPTRKLDKGCLNYDLHQSNDNPRQFVFYENWENRECLDRHLETPHIQEYLKKTKGIVESFEISTLTKIG